MNNIFALLVAENLLTAKATFSFNVLSFITHKQSHNSKSDLDIKKDYVTDCKEAIDDLAEKYDILKSRFGMSKTNKYHTIEDYIIDYIILTGRTLGQCNDQIIEILHQYFNQRMESSGTRLKTSLQAGKKLFRGVLHHNA